MSTIVPEHPTPAICARWHIEYPRYRTVMEEFLKKEFPKVTEYEICNSIETTQVPVAVLILGCTVAFGVVIIQNSKQLYVCGIVMGQRIHEGVVPDLTMARIELKLALDYVQFAVGDLLEKTIEGWPEHA